MQQSLGFVHAQVILTLAWASGRVLISKPELESCNFDVDNSFVKLQISFVSLRVLFSLSSRLKAMWLRFLSQFIDLLWRPAKEW